MVSLEFSVFDVGHSIFPAAFMMPFNQNVGALGSTKSSLAGGETEGLLQVNAYAG